MNKKQKTVALYILAALMLINIVLCIYLQIQKTATINGEVLFGDTCFDGTFGQGGCADVQLSEYGNYFGVSLPIWGIIAFAFMFFIIVCFAYSLNHRGLIKEDKDLNATKNFISLCFIIGAFGAAYFIYLQLFVLYSICKYCMILDTITILSAIFYTIKFKKSVSFFIP